MIVKFQPDADPGKLPTHKDLPDSDGAIVENFLEMPQSSLLTDSIRPWLAKLHPDHQFCIGMDNGIYWRITEPPLAGCKAPDWFYVPGVPPTLDGEPRRSYVLWQERVAPLLLIEYVSGSGAEEHDTTPWTGKFWVYEQGIQAAYYAIYDWRRGGKLEVYHLEEGRYRLMEANERGHYPIPPMGVELGLWPAKYMDCDVPWLRWYDPQGKMLPISEELVAQERQRTKQERQRTKQERQRAERLAERLRSLGEDPDKV